MRLLCGSDGVEKWDSEVWDEILSVQDIGNRVRVVVSTYQVSCAVANIFGYQLNVK